MATREPIYAALWNLFLGNAALAGRFVTTSRYLRHFDDVTPDEMPALFITQTGESWEKDGKGIPAKRTLLSHLVMYDYTGQPNAVMPSGLVNALLDVVDDAIEQPGNPGNVQTLGGLVEHVYINGQIDIAEGLLQGKSVVVVPIEILLP